MKKLNVFILAVLFTQLSYAQFVPKYDVSISSTFYNELIDMGVDNSGNVYLLGQKANANQDIVLVKCTTSSCNLIATYSENEDVTAFRLQVDGSGNCYFVGNAVEDNGGGGSPTGKTEAIVVKYNSSGSLQWVDRYEGGTSTAISYSNSFYDAELVGSTLYAVGYAYGGAAGIQNILISKYTSAGTRTLRNYNNGSIAEKAYKLKVDGSSIYMGVLDNGSLEYYSISTSFNSSTNPTFIGSFSTSWSTIDGMDKSGSNAAFFSDLGSSAQIAMYNGSSFKSNTATDIDNPESIIVDGSKAIVSGSSFYSTAFNLVIGAYNFSNGSEAFHSRLVTNSLTNSNDHQAFSSKAVGLFKDDNGDYIVPGNLVLDTNPNDGNPAITLYSGFAVFDNTGTQSGFSVYEVAVSVDQGIENPNTGEVIIAGSDLWVLCDPPVVDLGSNISEPYNPSGNNITIDAGSGFSSYSWSTGETSQSINVSTEGTYTVTVTNSAGCEASDNVSVSITSIDQTITWSQTIPTFTYGDGNYTLNATASSGLDVTFSSSNDNVAEAVLNGSDWELDIKIPGTVTITASQTGDGNYNAAATVQKIVSIDYADYYWVGGTGNYSDFSNHWATASGGSSFHSSVPDQYCNLIFDSNSFGSSNQTITFSDHVSCHDFSAKSVTNNPTFDNGFKILSIHGSIDFNSNVVYDIYNLDFSSSESETIDFGGLTVTGENLTFNGSGSWEIISDFTYNGNKLNVNSGTLTIKATNALITFRPIILNSGSSLTNNGSLIFESGANFLNNPGSSFSGNDFVFKRNTTFDNSTGKYSVVGSPITNASTSTLGSLVYEYDESPDFAANDGLDRFIEVNSPETMPAGKGYFSAYTGTIEVTGTPNTGTINVPLQFNTSTGVEDNYDGFNLVANPYPTGLDFQDFIDANGPNGTSVITAAIYLWVDGGSDAGRRTSSDYMTVNFIGTIGGNTDRSSDYNGWLGSFQGFFVQATGTGQTLSFTEDMRFQYGSWDANFFRLAEEKMFKLKIGLENNKNYSETLIGFTHDATKAEDPLYDALKLKGNNHLNISSHINAKSFSIQGRPIPYDSDIIPINFETEEEGNHSLSFDIENKPEFQRVSLIDTYLSKQINIEDKTIYSFTSLEGNFSDRFQILITQETITAIPHTVDSSIIYKFNNNSIAAHSTSPIQSMVVYDFQGRVLNKWFFDTAKTHLLMKFNNQHQKLIIIHAIDTDGSVDVQKIQLK